jgi:hypothetical protein
VGAVSVSGSDDFGAILSMAAFDLDPTRAALVDKA